MRDDDFEVGYGKPPKHSRFTKGRSGNPKGRPKGSQNIAYLMKKALEEKVAVKDAHGTRKMSKLDAGLAQLANKVASGDFRSIKEVVRWQAEIQEPPPPLPQPVFQIHFVEPPDYTKTPEEIEEQRKLNLARARNKALS